MNNDTASPASARPSLFRWLFSRRTLGRVLISLAALATLIALAGAEETWRGRRAWLRYKGQLEAQGEKLDFKDYVPPRVPDEQNFATTPFLAPLFDFNPEPLQEGQSRWRDTNGLNRASSLGLPNVDLPGAERQPDGTAFRMTDLPSWALALSGKTNQAAPAAAAPPLTRTEAATEVLWGLEKYDAVLDELRRASQRPYARFNIRYEEDPVSSTLLPHLAVLKGAASIFHLRACANVELGRTEQAWSDTRMALYLADTLKDEPFLISKLVQIAVVQISLKPVWEGLAEHKWSDAQLVDIERRLGQINLLADAAMRGERAFSIREIDQLRNRGCFDAENNSGRIPRPFSFLLGGFFYQNELSITRMYQQYFVSVADATNQRMYPSRALSNEAALAKAIDSGFRPYYIFARLLLPAIAGAETKFAYSQTRVNEAIVACALERHRLAEGRFPDSLAPLSPRFLEKMPHDIITGAPLIYRSTADGQFILYSVGWNEKDDGGTVALTRTKQPSRDLTQGDWVWQYPAPAASAGQKAAGS